MLLLHPVTRIVIALSLLSIGGSACAAPPAAPLARPPASQPAAQKPQPFLLHVPGVSGESIVDHTLVHGFVDGGLRAEIEIYDWTEHDMCQFNFFPALTDRYVKERQADDTFQLWGLHVWAWKSNSSGRSGIQSSGAFPAR